MPKTKKSPPRKSGTKVLLDFQDPELLQKVNAVAKEDAEPGMPANRNATIRKLLRKGLRTMGIRA